MIATDFDVIQRVDQWNAEVPDGTSVIVDVHGAKVRTKTRGKAMVINKAAVVSLMGVAGAVNLDAIVGVPYRRWVRLNRRGQHNHWVECEFESREAMELQINDMMRLDSRIESFEEVSARPADA